MVGLVPPNCQQMAGQLMRFIRNLFTCNRHSQLGGSTGKRLDCPAVDRASLATRKELGLLLF